MLISVTLSRTPPWSAAKRALLWTVNLTSVSVALLAATFALFIVTYVQAGGDLNAPAPKGRTSWSHSLGWMGQQALGGVLLRVGDHRGLVRNQAAGKRDRSKRLPNGNLRARPSWADCRHNALSRAPGRAFFLQVVHLRHSPGPASTRAAAVLPLDNAPAEGSAPTSTCREATPARARLPADRQRWQAS